MENPSIDSDFCSAGIELTIDLCALWRNDSVDAQTDSRSNTHSFLQACLEVFELLSFGVLYNFGEFASSLGIVHLFLESLVHFGVIQNVVEE